MKLMKRIAAIMLSVVMVLGMSSVVSATTTTTPSGSSPATRGKITITNTIPGQTYTIYKILTLESYNSTTGSYAYKAATTDWSTFLTDTSQGGSYVAIDTDGYVTKTTAFDDTTAAEFAKRALAYAKTNSIAATNTKDASAATVEFDDLELGYYLVDSSAGALCSLDTTNNQVNITEKNGVPSVKKEVEKGGTYVDENTASIGDTVKFQTTIIAKAGAENYVLHDTMSAGLTFDSGSVEVKWTDSTGAAKTYVPVKDTDYIVKISGLESATPCTFHIEFKKDFCDKLAADEKLIVTYSATLNKDAVIGTTGNTNKTYLSYGDDKKTTESATTTYTFEVPVFKYTNDTAGNKKGLAGAKFKLSTSNDLSAAGATIIKMTKLTGATEDTYCVDKTGTEEEIITTAITPTSAGKFTIKGLGAGIYYLHETKQPDGYNKLKDPVKIEISETGTITVNGAALSATSNRVEIENNTGSILPSTGGRGTTILYVLGALLVLGSSVVLITKRRMKE